MDTFQLILSEDDFTLINKALEAFPSSDALLDMLDIILPFDKVKDPNEKARLEAKRKVDGQRREQRREEIRENCRILQGTLLQYKRHLAQTGALKQANDIIGK